MVLDNEFPHLVQRVLPSAGHMLGDIGDLGPNHHAPLVAQIIEELVVLVVGQADGVGTHLTDQVYIPDMVFFREGIAHAPAVLMAGNTVQRVALSVEEEPPVGVNFVTAEAEPAADRVQQGIAQQQFRRQGVQIGIPASLPQVGRSHFQPGGARGCGHLVGHLPRGIPDGITHRGAFRRAADPAFHLYPAVGFRGDVQPAAAVVGQVKVGGGQADHIHVPVQTAVKGEVCHLGITPGGTGIKTPVPSHTNAGRDCA